VIRATRAIGRRVPTTLFVLGAVACATTPFRGDTGIKAFNFDLWDVHCPSGLRVIVERAPGSKWAAVTTVVGAGGAQDPPGREGLAHVVEHLTIRQSHEPDEAPMEHRLARLGTRERAFTDLDETVYPNLVPAHLLSALLDAEGRRLAKPLAGVDGATFAVERDIVRNELREGHETEANGESFDAANRAAFPSSHPYSRPVIGTHESLNAITLDDARRFADAHYRPEAMTMVIVGDIDLSTVDAFVRAHLPPALYGDPAHPRPLGPPAATPTGPPPLADAAAALHVTAAVASPEIWIAWTTPGGYGVDRYAGEMWAGLSQGNFYRARLDDADVASVDFFSSPHVLASLFVCRVRLATGTHPDQSLREVLATLPWTGGDDTALGARFDHLKLDSLRDLAFAAESPTNRALERARFAHFVGGANAYGALVDSAKAITDDVAVDFARRYLDPSRARVVLVRPIARDERPAAKATLASAPTPTQRYKETPELTLGDLADVRNLGGLDTKTLSSGLEVVTLPRPGAPVVTVSLAFHGGSADAAAGVADAAREGLETHWEESPGDYGVSWSFQAERDVVQVTMRAGAANLPRVLDMLSFLVRSYEVDWPSDKFLSVRLPWLRREDDTAQSRNARAFMRTLFATHGLGAIATADEMARVTKSAITEWLDRVLVPANAMLVIVGDVDAAVAQQAARDAFGGWHASGAALPPSPQPSPGAARAPADALSLDAAIVANRPGATQAEVLLGCVLPRADAHAEAVYAVTSDKVRGSLLPLRERLGSTYDIEVEAPVWRGGGAMLRIHSKIDNRRLAIAVKVMRMYWRWAATANLRGIPSEDAHAKQLGLDRALRRLRAFDNSAELASALVETWNRGWPLDAVDDETAALGNVKATEVADTLHACARNLVLAVTGDQDVIRGALAPTLEPAWPGRSQVAAPPRPDPAPSAAP
jgi:zinc protease